MPSLKELILDGNTIEIISSLEGLPKLETFRVSGNVSKLGATVVFLEFTYF